MKWFFNKSSILWVLVFIQFCLVSTTFPISELLSDAPLFYIDGAMHWYRLTLATNLAEQGNLIGYDPFFNAGFVQGIHANPAAKIPSFFAILLNSYVDEIVIWKIYSFFIAVSLPIITIWGLHVFGLNKKEIIFGLLLAIVLFWVSRFRWFHTAGLVSYVAVAYLAIPYTAYIYKYLIGGYGWKGLVLLGLAGALCMYIHPLFAVIIFFTASPLVFFVNSALTFKRFFNLVFIPPTIIVLLNFPWAYPKFFETFLIGTSYGSHQSYADISIVFKELFGIWDGYYRGSKLNLILLLLSAVAILTEWKTTRRNLVASLLISWLLLVFYASLGSYIDVLASFTQPNRFASAGYLLLVVPAGIGVVGLYKFVFSNCSQKFTRYVAGLFLIFCTSGVLYTFYEVKREVSYENIGHYGKVPPEVTGIGDKTSTILDWIEAHTSKNGRILFEISNGRFHDDSHIAPYLAYASGREFVGGPYPRFNFSNFWDGFIFGKPINAYSYTEFQKYLNLYNLRWIIVHTQESRDYLADAPGITLNYDDKGLSFYTVDVNNESFFLKGKGNVVSRDHNFLAFENVKGNEVIIKYHYFSELETDPPVSMSPIFMLDDPNPFIKLNNPPEEFQLFLP